MTVDHVTTANGDSSEWINGGLETRMRLEPGYFYFLLSLDPSILSTFTFVFA
jgi:hypothetical protein